MGERRGGKEYFRHARVDAIIEAAKRREKEKLATASAGLVSGT